MYYWIMIYACHHNPNILTGVESEAGFLAILDSYLSLMYVQKVEVSFDNSYYKTSI